KRLKAASQSGAGAIIVRAWDFFGPGTTANSCFSSGLVTPGKPVGTIRNPARRGIGTKIINIARQNDSRADGASSGDGIVEHRQHKRFP
ncbi:hypothetical protein ACC772_38495, partial [Rhizobium ruizarguesonis]